MKIRWAATYSLEEVAQDIRTYNREKSIYILIEHLTFVYDIDSQTVTCPNTDKTVAVSTWSLDMILAYCLGYFNSSTGI